MMTSRSKLACTTGGQLVSITHPGGVTVDYTHDTAGRITGIDAHDGSTSLFDFAYSYQIASADSHLVGSRSDAVTGTTTYYGYNERDELVSAFSYTGGVLGEFHHYTYDGAGNRLTHNGSGTTTSFAYNVADQLTADGTRTLSYDGHGNWTSSSGSDAFSYDDINRTTSLQTSAAGPLSAVYRGDDQVGRASLGAATFATTLLGVTAEHDGTAWTGYTRLPDGTPLAIRRSGSRHAVLPDMLNSTIGLADTTGTFTTRYRYTPYGQTTVTALTGGHIDQPLRFTGQYQDPTGLYRMGLRHYNPDQARWTQPDPALSLAQLPFANTYTYVGGNPINGIDPAGASTLGCVVSAGTLALGGVATVVAGFTSGGAALLGGVQLAGGLYGYVESGCS